MILNMVWYSDHATQTMLLRPCYSDHATQTMLLRPCYSDNILNVFCVFPENEVPDV